MPINLKAPQLTELKPRTVVCGVGGAGGNAINNMIVAGLSGIDTTFVDAFAMADQLLCSGISCITDLMVKEGLVNLDLADVCSVMSEMGDCDDRYRRSDGGTSRPECRRRGDRQPAV